MILAALIAGAAASATAPARLGDQTLAQAAVFAVRDVCPGVMSAARPIGKNAGLLALGYAKAETIEGGSRVGPLEGVEGKARDGDIVIRGNDGTMCQVTFTGPGFGAAYAAVRDALPSAFVAKLAPDSGSPTDVGGVKIETFKAPMSKGTLTVQLIKPPAERTGGVDLGVVQMVVIAR